MYKHTTFDLEMIETVSLLLLFDEILPLYHESGT